MAESRLERDPLGEKPVPSSALYGIQTLRAAENFPISGLRPLPAAISKNLITVEVRGQVTGNPKDMKYHMKPLPMVVDPLLLMRDRLIGTTPEMRLPGIDLGLPRFGDFRYRIWG